MKSHKKLVVIQEYCEHENEYRSNNKGKFWSIIDEFLKQKTEYTLIYLMQTITQ